MLRRFLHDESLRTLKSFPAILLTGARQVGKSTLAQQLVSSSWNARYVTLDDRANLDAALRDPDGFVDALPTPTILDEVQRAPHVLLSIKRAIDRNRSPGAWLLTGSANVMTLSSVSDSLAGRVAFSRPQALVSSSAPCRRKGRQNAGRWSRGGSSREATLPRRS